MQHTHTCMSHLFNAMILLEIEECHDIGMPWFEIDGECSLALTTTYDTAQHTSARVAHVVYATPMPVHALLASLLHAP